MEKEEVLQKLQILERMIQINPLPKNTDSKLTDLRFVQELKDLVMRNKKPHNHEYAKCDELFRKWGGNTKWKPLT